MKYLSSLLAALVTMAAASQAFALSASFFTVTPTVNPAVPSVRFTWDVQHNAINSTAAGGVQVYRRDYGVEANGFANDYYTLLTPTGVKHPTTTFTDTTVQAGKTYEYRIRRPSFSVTNTATPPVTTTYGARDVYVSITVNSQLVDSRGTVIFVVDETLPPEMEQELQLAEMDMVGDGWNVKRLTCAQHISYEKLPSGDFAHMLLKERIVDAYNADWNTEKDESNVKALYLFGRLPIARSGSIGYDGHGGRSHETDAYYADMHGEWKDESLTNSATGDDANIPGDGKFDVNTIGVANKIDLMTGRVDFAKMSNVRKNEREYLRDYIQKAHSWKHNIKMVPYRIQHTITNEVYNDGSSRNQQGPITAPKALTTTGWIPTLETQPHIMSNAINFVPQSTCDRDHQVIFANSFGSWRQQWSTWNNAMRMSLAQAEWGLTVGWGHRPTWLHHHLPSGAPAGYMWMRTINNYANGNEYTNIDSYGNSAVHINLLGDPTVRFVAVPPAKNLRFSAISGASATLAWDAAPAMVALPEEGAPVTSTRVGYHVYRSTERTSGYMRLTGANPTTATTFRDTSRPTGTDVYYQVRTVYRTTVPTGTYNHQSQGIFNILRTDNSSNTRPVANRPTTVVATSDVPTLLPFVGTGSTGSTLTPIVVKNPENGQIRWNAGKAYYTSNRVVQEVENPKPQAMRWESVGYTGADSVTYRLWDGLALSEPVTIPIKVVAPNSNESKLLLGWSFNSYTIEKGNTTVESLQLGTTWSFLPRTADDSSYGWKYVTGLSNAEPDSTYNNAVTKPSTLSIGSAYTRWTNDNSRTYNHDAFAIRTGFNGTTLDEDGYIEWTVAPIEGRWQSLDRVTFFAFNGNRQGGYQPDDKPTDCFKMELRASRDEDFATYEVLPIDGVDSNGEVYSATVEKNGGRIFSADLRNVAFMQKTVRPMKFRLYVWDVETGYSVGIGKSADTTTGRSYPIEADVWTKVDQEEGYTGPDVYEWKRNNSYNVTETLPFQESYDLAVFGTTVTVPNQGRVTTTEKVTSFVAGEDEFTLQAPALVAGVNPDFVTYQWYKRLPGGTWEAIPGAQDATFKTNQNEPRAEYYCEVTLEGLLKQNTPAITITTLYVGNIAIEKGKPTAGQKRFAMSYPFTLEVENATSGLSISYQWFKSTNGGPAKAFRSGRLIRITQDEDSATYFCRVRSGAAQKDTASETIEIVTYPVYETRISARTSTIREMRVAVVHPDDSTRTATRTIHYRAPITKSYTIMMGYENEDKERTMPSQTGYGRMWGADNENAFVMRGDTMTLLGQDIQESTSSIGVRGLNIPLKGEYHINYISDLPTAPPSMSITFTGVGTFDPRLRRIASSTGFAYGTSFQPASCPLVELRCAARNHLNNKDANPDQGLLDRTTLVEESSILGETLSNVYYPQPCYVGAVPTPVHFFGTYTKRYNLSLTRQMGLDWSEPQMKGIVDKRVPARNKKGE